MTRSDDPDRDQHNRQDKDKGNDDDDDDDEGHPGRDRSRKSSGSRHSSASPNKKKKRKLASNSNARSHHQHQHHHDQEPQQEQAAVQALDPDLQPQPASPAEVAAATLLEHFRQILQGEGGPHAYAQQPPEIDFQKARNALEATAGNMQMAAQLYWDDYFASQAANDNDAEQQQQQQEVDQNQKPPAREGGGESDCDDDDDEEDDDDNNNNNDNNEEEGVRNPHRRLRRSLDVDFRAADDSSQENKDDENDEEDDDDEGTNNVRERHLHVRERHRQRQLVLDAIAGQQERLRVDMGESVSVSDDETGCAGVWRTVGSMVARLDDDNDNDDSGNNNVNPRRNPNRRLPPNDVGVGQHARIRKAAAAVANKVLPQQEGTPEDKKKRKPRKEDEEDEDYISDSDWLEEEAASIRSPFEVLWGTGDPEAASSSSVNENANGAEGNVVADDDAEDQQNAGSGIPHTWLNASFSLSSCGTGLGVKPPKVEDIEFFAWRQQQIQGRNSLNGAPPPYHCKAITAILSVVTAMIYTGASIQGRAVNCTSARKPFIELTPEERKLEFEPRLADALSALIYVAAKASMERKRQAMRKATVVEKDNEVKLKNMQRRLRLIPTCSWEDDPSSVMPRLPEAPLYRRIQVATSLTNINDIRIYVLSTLRSFTARGGVALLLETILRIHGKGVIARMIQRARQEAKLVPESESSSQKQQHLIGCNCEDRQKKMYEQNPLPASVRNDPTKMLDTTPPGHECVSVELLSLLLTGSVHSSWKGWSTQGLEFGFLTEKSGEVGWNLARPEKPVWVLQGETGYSVLYLEDGKEIDSKTISKLDKPGTVFGLGHWNCWYGERNKSGMRLITAASQWKPPAVSSQKCSGDVWKASRGSMEPRDTTQLLIERRRERRASLVSADEHEANETKERESRITPEELERAKPNPEDERFYKGKYRMWRFDMGAAAADKDKEDESSEPGDVKKRAAEHWIPYHRLTARQKLLVEMKLGPKIKSILWSRWPGATIDNFTPADEAFPIV